MGKQNYRESIEKDRQEISVASPAAPTRRAERKSVKKPPKKQKNILLPTLFFLFILIPVTILIYVAFLYEPDDTITTKANSNEVSIETNTSPETPIVPVEVADDKEKDKEKAEQEKVEKEKAEKEKAEQEKAEKQKAEIAAAEQAKKEEEAKEQEAAKMKEIASQEAAAKEREKAAEAAKAKEEAEEKPAASKTVVVKPQETLYRIAVNNYGAAGAAAAVEKIKQANGLASNAISPGQTLILP
jgi:colicin import membrane protein